MLSSQSRPSSEVCSNLDSTDHDSSLSSDSDHGYVTPVENFADDERPQETAVVRVAHPRTPVADSAGLLVVEPELREKVVQQVEWYFSDENLLKDSFLMKHIHRNKQGYVSLKLISSLRKVKALTKDWCIVLQSLKESSLLILNEDGTKVRRNTPAPQVDFSHVSRTILITNYPSNVPTIQEIEQQFGKFGEVMLVRILHPGRAIPLDVKPCRTHHSEIGNNLCILVEFESEAGAKKACKKFLDQQSWRDEIKVQMLSEKKPEKTASNEVSQADSKPTVISSNNRRRKKSDNPKKDKLNGDELSSRYTSEASPSPRQSRETTPSKQLQQKQSPPSSESRWPHSVVKDPVRKLLHPDAHKEYSSDSGCSRSSSESPKNSPSPIKRYFSGDLGPSWRKTEKHVHVKDSVVIRKPLGPDSSGRGFGPRRIPLLISIQAC